MRFFSKNFYNSHWRKIYFRGIHIHIVILKYPVNTASLYASKPLCCLWNHADMLNVRKNGRNFFGRIFFRPQKNFAHRRNVPISCCAVPYKNFLFYKYHINLCKLFQKRNDITSVNAFQAFTHIACNISEYFFITL